MMTTSLQRGNERGIALFLTLGFTTILLMMLAATITSSTGGNIFSQDYHRKTAALYAAESGLAMVQEELENDPNWTAGFNGVDTPLGKGKVWVSFGPSVNNLIPSTATSTETGPYGEVGPGTAYIRVEGRADGQTEVIECIIGRKSEDFLSSAIVATGKIQFDEGVNISGRVSSEDNTLAEADVISNYDEDAPWGNGTPPVNWHDPASGPNQIAGTVRSASPPTSSISNNLRGISSEALTDQIPVSVENVDIERAVRAKNGSGAISRTPTGPFTGDFYSSGYTEVNGDIVLANGSLYIEGDLKVIGSISGVGAVYVTGDTTFAGHSTVMSNEDGVVLYSQGNVHLRGFDGTEWMDSVAAARGITLQWNETKECIRRLEDALTTFAANPQFTAAANPALAPPPGTPAISPPGSPPAISYYWRTEAGLIAQVLGTTVSGFRPPGITGTNLLSQVSDVINTEPSGLSEYDTKDFMSKKFAVLYDSSANWNLENRHALGINPGVVDSTLIQDFGDGAREGHVRATGLQVELFLAAALIDGDTLGPPRFDSYVGLTANELRTALLKHEHWLRMYDLDRLGESYFQGNIYTRGAIYASNEVTILGSLNAVARPNDNSTWTPTDVDPDDDASDLRAGDVYLGHGTKIVHLGHLKPGVPSATPPVGVVRWIR